MDRQVKGKTTFAQVSESTLKLQAFLETCKEGEEMSYDQIEHKSGVKMNTKGKTYLRTALKRAKLEYSPIIGYGIKLADTESTLPIISSKLNKIDRAVKRADKSHKNLQAKFFESLSETEQKQLLFIGAAFGAIRIAAENGRLMYQSKNKINNTINIPIPQY